MMNYKNKRRLLVGFFSFLLLILYIFRSYSVILRIIGLSLGFVVFYFIDHSFNLEFSLKHYVYFLIIAVFGVLLSPLYFISENYDKVLHLILPIFAASIIFFMVNKLDIKFQWKLLLTFLVIVSFLAFHEIGEYLLDKLLDLKLQGVYLRSEIVGLEATKLNLVQEKIDDTMIDMIFGVLSAIIFSIGKSIEYYFKKGKGKTKGTKK